MQTAIGEEIIKIQPKGIITIPAKFRKLLGLEEKGLARIKTEKGRIILEPIRTLPYPVRSYTDKDLVEFFDLDAKETKAQKKKA